MVDDWAGLPRTRAEAKDIGARRYFTGEPCGYGHVSARFTSNRRCIACSMEARAKWGEENADHLTEYRKRYYAENAEEILAKWRAWHGENKEHLKEKKAERYMENREANLLYAAQYREENPEKVKAASAKWRDENPEKVKAGWDEWYEKNGKARDALRRSTPRGRVDDAMGNGIYHAIRGRKAGRRWESLVGYSLDDLMAHLERLFQPGMTWENYGQWHIDHKTPKAAFNYTAPEHIDFKRCWALSNLQPLWAEDNIRKHARLEKPFQPSLPIAG